MTIGNVEWIPVVTSDLSTVRAAIRAAIRH